MITVAGAAPAWADDSAARPDAATPSRSQSSVGPWPGRLLVAADADLPPEEIEQQERKKSARQAALLLVSLVAGFVMIVAFVLIRIFRPKPMQHKGPSSMVDHWQEAGRRLK